MKNKNHFINISLGSLFIFALLISCDPNVLFREAVPPGVDSISSVPEIFQGVYLCESDSSRMYADEFAVYNESYHMFITTIGKVKETENCSIVAGGIYLPGRSECIPFEYIGDDTIMAKVYSIDTLFSFRKEEVMKLYKGRLFMNYTNKREEWVTYMITPLEDGSMNWEMINVPDQVRKIEAITHDYTTRVDRDDELKYIIKPTLVEFDRILEKEYTRSCDILTPINLEL